MSSNEAKTQWTPGPWEWSPDKWNGGYSGLFTADGSDVVVPQCRNDGDTGAAWFEEISEANARLIAAAPELCAALVSAMGRLQCGCEVPHYGGLPITSEDRCDECKKVAALLQRITQSSTVSQEVKV